MGVIFAPLVPLNRIHWSEKQIAPPISHTIGWADVVVGLIGILREINQQMSNLDLFSAYYNCDKME